MKEIKIIRMTEDEIVFASTQDIDVFYSEVMNCQNNVLVFWDDTSPEGKKLKRSELIAPLSIVPKINDGRLKVRSKEVVE